MEHLSMESAVRAHVRPGDTIQFAMGHTRWSAILPEIYRQHAEGSPDFTLLSVNLSTLFAPFVARRLLRGIVTAYAGDPFPAYSPNPVLQEAISQGAIEAEHSSLLSYVQRLEAGARGLPAAVTTTLAGSSLGDSDVYAEADSPFGPIGLLRPLRPDIAVFHAPVADEAGNVALAPPLLEGLWGAWGARRGAVVSVEAVVPDLRAWSEYPILPAHRVLAVVEARFGGHPGGVHPRRLPAPTYAEDVAFWTSARNAVRADAPAFAKEWFLDTGSHMGYLKHLGSRRLRDLELEAAPQKARRAAEVELPSTPPVTPAETAAVLAARRLGVRIVDGAFRVVLAGAGVANLAAWVGVLEARAQGHDVELTAEIGTFGYTPVTGNPQIFNHHLFPTSVALNDTSNVLGLLLGGPGTRSLGCISAPQIDQHGNVNSTFKADGGFLVGSGGAADVARRATECLAVAIASPRRLLGSLDYVTSPGERVATLVTDLGTFEKREGRLVLTAVVPLRGSVDAAVRELGARCGWPLEVAPEPQVLAPVTTAEVETIRRYDPERLFLS